MKKVLTLLTVVTFFALQSEAQSLSSSGPKGGGKKKSSNSKSANSGILLGGSLGYGLPQDDFKNGYKSSLALDATAGVKLFGGFYVTANVGYAKYYAQDNNSFGNITNIPLKAGVKAYLTKRIFVAGNYGIGLLKDEKMSSRDSRTMLDYGAGIRFNVGEIGVYNDGWKRESDGKYSNAIFIKAGFYLR
jgi:hypothetical protein